LRQLALPPRTVLLLDNVRFHHSAESRVAAAEKGFDLLFVPVPPYSPWFNPIETVFSVIKRHYYQNHDAEAALAIVQQTHVLGAFRHSFSACHNLSIRRSV
jgi:transposase